jgi:hypothetical protein
MSTRYDQNWLEAVDQVRRKVSARSGEKLSKAAFIETLTLEADAELRREFQKITARSKTAR